MLPFWAKTTLARSFSRAFCGVFALLFAAGLSGAAGLEALARAFRDKPTPANRAALLRFAAVHPKDRDGALAILAVVVSDREKGQAGETAELLRRAAGQLTTLSDYVAYYLAAAAFDRRDFAAAASQVEAVWACTPSSPMAGDAAMLAARAYKEIGKSQEGVRVLRANYNQLPQPSGDLLLAMSYRGSNDLASAAVYYQRVYYQYPATLEAEQAASALSELRTSLGDLYPPPATEAMFDRAEKWLRAREFVRAASEYESIAARTAGLDRERARLRLAEIDFFRYESGSAYAKLSALNVSAPEVDAERLYYLVECARRLSNDSRMQENLDLLAARHRRSPWRLKALVTAGNRYLLDNLKEQYEPLFAACAEDFPTETQADYCHWKVVWAQYIRRRPEAAEWFRNHLLKFPGSERASSALYFLGRLSEAARQPDDAKAYYAEAVERFPNHYYSDLAEERLAEPAIFKAAASTTVRAFLDNVVWPVRRYPAKFEPTPATRLRIDRGRLLELTGLDQLCEREFRFGARTDGQPHVLAIHLARATSRFDSPSAALRMIKGMVPGYLSMPLDSAPGDFWRLLFPLPYRNLLERYAKAQDLDPFLVAGLIRQESEFNPQALSPAKAYGLTQIMPATGRELLKVSQRRFRPSVLFQPDVNLRLGTTHLRRVLDQNSAKWELALAAYNAGGSRVQNWLKWGDYREAAEFIETIPFTETRTYVFAVLRNAQIYRKLYTSGALAAEPVKEIMEKPAAPTVKKGSGFKRAPVPKKRRVRRR